MTRHVRWDGSSEAEQKDRASGHIYLVFVLAALEGARSDFGCVSAAATDFVCCVSAAATDAFVFASATGICVGVFLEARVLIPGVICRISTFKGFSTGTLARPTPIRLILIGSYVAPCGRRLDRKSTRLNSIHL